MHATVSHCSEPQLNVFRVHRSPLSRTIKSKSSSSHLHLPTTDRVRGGSLLKMPQQLLSPEIHQALTQLLQALQAPDNTIRSHAEEQLSTEWVSARPDVLLMGLVEQVQDGNDPTVRGLFQAFRGTFMTNPRHRCETSLPLCSGVWPQRHENCLEMILRENCSLRYKMANGLPLGRSSLHASTVNTRPILEIRSEMQWLRLLDNITRTVG